MSSPYPEGFHPHDWWTDEERDISNRWSMWGWASIRKVRSRWDSGVPGAPFDKTKTAAHERLTRFVCEAIPLRCLERFESALKETTETPKTYFTAEGKP